MTKSNIAEAVPAQEPWLNKAAATKILDLALELEKTGRLVSLMSDNVGDRQERTYFVSRNRNVEHALRDALAILVAQSSIAQPVQPAYDTRQFSNLTNQASGFSQLVQPPSRDICNICGGNSKGKA